MSLRDDKIDLITDHPTEGYVNLIMIADDDWADSSLPERIQNKLNLYLAYALDGQLAADFPDLARKQVRIQLDCVVAPPVAIVRLVDRMAETCRTFGIYFYLNNLPPSGN